MGIYIIFLASGNAIGPLSAGFMVESECLPRLPLEMLVDGDLLYRRGLAIFRLALCRLVGGQLLCRLLLLS